MGTRALLHIKDGENALLTIYRQYDGYPEGMGEDIKNIAGHLEIVNGFSDRENKANGMGCLAAQIVAGLKNDVGNVYIYPAGVSDVWEEYTYVLTEKEGRVHVNCTDFDSVVYDGFLSDWDTSAAS